ncbi:MAG: hypothetical protein VXW87_01825 [Pseudomonadota bacterium]|nr:hypothetical protein [Pseudomonadota bacterium]
MYATLFVVTSRHSHSTPQGGYIAYQKEEPYVDKTIGRSFNEKSPHDPGGNKEENGDSVRKHKREPPAQYPHCSKKSDLKKGSPVHTSKTRINTFMTI